MAPVRPFTFTAASGPPGFGLLAHITLKLQMVSIDCGFKTSDRMRDDNKIQVSKQRKREGGEIWQSDCTLASCYRVGTASTA